MLDRNVQELRTEASVQARRLVETVYSQTQRRLLVPERPLDQALDNQRNLASWVSENQALAEYLKRQGMEVVLDFGLFERAKLAFPLGDIGLFFNSKGLANLQPRVMEIGHRVSPITEEMLSRAWNGGSERWVKRVANLDRLVSARKILRAVA